MAAKSTAETENMDGSENHFIIAVNSLVGKLVKNLVISIPTFLTCMNKKAFNS